MPDPCQAAVLFYLGLFASIGQNIKQSLLLQGFAQTVFLPATLQKFHKSKKTTWGKHTALKLHWAGPQQLKTHILTQAQQVHAVIFHAPQVPGLGVRFFLEAINQCLGRAI